MLNLKINKKLSDIMRLKNKRLEKMQKKYERYGYKKTPRGYKKTVIG